MTTVSQHRPAPTEHLPRTFIAALLCLLALVLALLAGHRFLGLPTAAVAPKPDLIAAQSIRIQGTIDGAARITGPGGRVIADLGKGEGVFITTIDRAMRRERLKMGVDLDGPYLLRMRAGGTLYLFDPSTDHETSLASFGTDNVAAFAALWDATERN